MEQLWKVLVDDVSTIAPKSGWTVRNGIVVPEIDDVLLGKGGVRLDATVLYADLVDSTGLVTKYKDIFAAAVHKSYLSCACKIIKNYGGTIVGFDGDRVMAIFVGETKETNAMCSALWINEAVNRIINPKLFEQWKCKYKVRQVVGIDTGNLLVTKTGVRGDNDLVWVGAAANYAAKLCSIRSPSFTSWCTEAVYKSAAQSVKFHNKQQLWHKKCWTKMNDKIIYGSMRNIAALE